MINMLENRSPKDIGERLRAARSNAGLTQQAIATIRAIIALNPPNVQAYQKLLAQIGG